MCQWHLLPFEQVFGYPYACTTRAVPPSALSLPTASVANAELRRWVSVPSGPETKRHTRRSIERNEVATEKSNKANDAAQEKATTERQKALDTALAQIERQFGKGSVMKMSDRANQIVEVIPTGSIALDIALGIGGLPRGRIVEIYGPESSGKTTLTLHAIANAQKAGGICAFIDAEHAFDAEYAKKLGVDIDALLVSQPDTGEQALEIMDMLIRSGALDLVVVDSVAALVPRAEIEGEMGDSHMGLQARLMSQALRKITGALHQSKTTAIFTNFKRSQRIINSTSCTFTSWVANRSWAVI